MIYYIAICWNPSNAVEHENSRKILHRLMADNSKWSTALHLDGLAVFYQTNRKEPVDRLYLVGLNSGVVIGRLFEHTNTVGSLPTPVELTPEHAAAVIRSAGRYLVDRYWGRYVAFLHDEQLKNSIIFRDPSGMIPCLSMEYNGMRIYANRVDDLEELTRRPLSINWRYVKGYITYSNVCGRETGLNEVTNVLAGERIEINKSQTRSTFLWNPLEVAQRRAITNIDEAVKLTRNTIRNCVHAWASCFENIKHELSGGLDSSIVLACLSDSPNRPRIICVNRFAKGSNSDERRFAQQAAQRVSAELVVEESTAPCSLQLLDNFPKTISPFPCTIDVKGLIRKQASAAMGGRVGVFNGHGGDEVFCRTSPLPTTVDCLYFHGLHRALLSFALNDAKVDGTSVIRVLRAACLYGLLRRPWIITDLLGLESHQLISTHILEEVRSDRTLVHPLYRQPTGVPPVKQYQAYRITASCVSMFNPLLANNPAVAISPLCSQPIIELVLQIPTFLFRIGGQDRAIARLAFQRELPPQIFARRVKAGSVELNRAVLQKNINALRSLLLDGLLVKKGYLDRNRLYQVLSGRPTRIKGGAYEIFIYASTEAWLQRWNRGPAVIEGD